MSSPAYYKRRVARLWDYVSKALARSLDSNQPFHLSEAILEKLASWFPGFGFEYGMGKDGFYFILTPQGDPYLRPLVDYCIRQAPRHLVDLRLFKSRQRWEGEDIPLSNGQKISPLAVWVAIGELREDGRVDLILNRHPNLSSLVRHYGWAGVRRMLHFAIGEDMTTDWVGKLTFAAPGNMKKAFPLTELADEIAVYVTARQWQPPVNRGHIYCPNEIEMPFRDDVLLGFSRELALIDGFYGSRGQWSDPFKGTGATYQYLTMPASSLPPGGKPLEFIRSRSELIGAAIGDSGEVIGYAEGEDYCYVDLLLFESARVITQKLRKLGLDNLGIRPFAG